jgi:predicted transposase YdaD
LNEPLPDNLPELDDLPEMEEMIGERIDIWKRELKREGKREGRQEGKLEGQMQLLLRFLMRRFGVLPPAVVTQVHAGSLEQIEQWFDASMDAPNLNAVFALR